MSLGLRLTVGVFTGRRCKSAPSSFTASVSVFTCRNAIPLNGFS